MPDEVRAVLFVDSHGIVREGIAQQFKKAGLVVIEASTSDEVDAILELIDVLCVMVGTRLSRAEQDTAVRRAREIRPSVPVFLLASGNGNGYEGIDGRDGLSGFLPDTDDAVRVVRARAAMRRRSSG